MRLRLVLAWSAVPFALAACTSLLGTFTVGDAGASDAAPDAPPALTCAEQQSSRKAITTGNALHSYKVRIASLTNDRIRIVVPDFVPSDSGGSNVVVRAFTIDRNNQNAVSELDLPTNGGNVYSIARYADGFAVLYEANDPNQANKSFVYMAHLQDDAPDWSTPVDPLESPSAGVTNARNNATFVPVDPKNDQYFVAYSTTSNGTQTVFAGPVGPSNVGNFVQVDTFPALSSGDAAYNFQEPSIALEPTKPPFIMMAPNGQNGPPQVGTPVKVIVPGQPSFLLTPPSDLNYFPTAFSNAATPGRANVLMLVANLNTFQGGYHVGQVDYGALNPSFDPTTLAFTQPPSDGGKVALKDLFVGNENAHWEVAGTSGEQLLLVGGVLDPLAQTSLPGINFAWWDGSSGANRVYATGDKALLPDVQNVAIADTTIGTLVGSIGTFWFAYISDVSNPGQGGNPVAGDLYFTSVACQLP